MKKTRYYLVTVKQDTEITDKAMAEYIEGAVAEMKGCLSPDDDIFRFLDSDDVACSPYKKEKPVAEIE